MLESGESVGWAVVNTHAHKEALALSNLTRQGFTTYCPMIAKRVRHARRFAEVYRPLFPSYVFVALDPGVERWRPILSTFGVRDLIRTGTRPNLLAGEFIDALRARETHGVIARSGDELMPGQQVTLRGGYFEGLTARILEHEQNERVTLLLDLLHGQVKASVPRAEIITASN